MIATQEETQRNLETMTELAAKYQTERDAYRALLVRCATGLRDGASLAEFVAGNYEDGKTEEAAANVAVDLRALLAALRAAGVEPTP